ncbi:MAG: ABC transporter permease [Deltaproteobacteria bacterium]|nr:ABC transporter permease [Deltaproteobacteria bacterium]
MLWETILLALREIRRNVLRSSLTVLGIVIGVAAVIIMVTLGGGATVQVSEQIASLGSNLLMITPGQRIGMGQRSAAATFDVDDAEAIARDIGSISAVAPSSSQGVTVVFGNENWSTRVTGIDGQYFKVRNWTIESGREFASGELRAGKAVCILGATARKELFGGQDPLGSSIRVENVSCQVIGILEAKGQSTMGTDRDDLILIPLRTFQRRIAGNQDIGLIQVSVQDGVSTDKVKQDVERLMRVRRHISPSEDDDFSVLAPRKARRLLQGESPCREGISNDFL